jgi:hypothetical protein
MCWALLRTEIRMLRLPTFAVNPLLCPTTCLMLCSRNVVSKARGRGERLKANRLTGCVGTRGLTTRQKIHLHSTLYLDLSF